MRRGPGHKHRRKKKLSGGALFFVVVLAVGICGVAWSIFSPDYFYGHASKRPQPVSNLFAKKNFSKQAPTQLTTFVTIHAAPYAYRVLDHYFDSSVSLETPDGSTAPSGREYTKVFITFLRGGKVRASKGFTRKTEESKNIFLHLRQTLIRAIEDERFGGVIDEEESKQLQIVIQFMKNRKRLDNQSLQMLKKQIEPGIHAISLRQGNNRAIYKESVPISKNWSIEKTLERLCKKAKLPTDCYINPQTRIDAYDVETFLTNRSGEAVPLIRYSNLIQRSELSNTQMLDSLLLAKKWIQNNINEATGRLEYLYYPSQDQYSSKTNDVRNLAALWAVIELDNFFDYKFFNELIEGTLSYYQSFLKETDSFAYLEIKGESKIAYSAFLILALLNYSYDENQELIERLADGLLSRQQKDGSFYTRFNSNSVRGIDYYPGEALLALMQLYEKSGEERYLKATEKAFRYYRSYWWGNKSTAFVPWHTQAYYLLHQVTGDKKVADFIFEMNDWLIDRYQIESSPYPDELGGFPKGRPTISTSSYLEGITDAYRLAQDLADGDHIQKYAESIGGGIRFLLQLQLTEVNSFYLRNPSRAIGGFRGSLGNNRIRNDNVQHAIMALMKTHQLDLV